MPGRRRGHPERRVARRAPRCWREGRHIGRPGRATSEEESEQKTRASAVRSASRTTRPEPVSATPEPLLPQSTHLHSCSVSKATVATATMAAILRYHSKSRQNLRALLQPRNCLYLQRNRHFLCHSLPMPEPLPPSHPLGSPCLPQRARRAQRKLRLVYLVSQTSPPRMLQTTRDPPRRSLAWSLERVRPHCCLCSPPRRMQRLLRLLRSESSEEDADLVSCFRLRPVG